MFNLFRKKEAHPPISEKEVDKISAALTNSMIEEMENYDVLFYDVWQPLRVPAARILKDIKDAGYHLPTLIGTPNATYHNRDTRPRYIEVVR